MSKSKLLFFIFLNMMGFSAFAFKASLNGSNIPRLSEIIDAQGHSWKIVSEVIQKDGETVGNNYNADTLLYFNGFMYQRNTSQDWFKWDGTTWGSTSDPRTPSVSGASLSPGSKILIDAQSHVWLLNTDNIAYIDGKDAGDYDTINTLFYKNTVYTENSSHNWYSWTGDGWFKVTGDPRSTKQQSIKNWTTCDGIADDLAGVTKAFAAARFGAFTLLVDCPVKIHIGKDIGKTIFIDNGTNVVFSGSGKFIVDNVMVPAFAVANSNNITFTNLVVEYSGSIPVDPDTGGYYQDGAFVSREGHVQPAGAFNDIRMNSWLTQNRKVIFDRSKGWVSSFWSGPVVSMAFMLITGESSNVIVTNAHLSVPSNVGGSGFLPMAFAFSRNFRSHQTVTALTPTTRLYLEVPRNIIFSNVVFDGTYMGFLGNLQDSTFEHIESHRYADLQDANGGNVGGIGKWFSPPHLFYINYDFSADRSLGNKNLQISHVMDVGPRVGVARDKGGSDTLSGFALSLKLGCDQCSVDGYYTNRPDGFMDVLPSNGLTIANVTATYDSSFLNNLFPGWRFPKGPYTNVTFDNVSYTDKAAHSIQPPMGFANSATNKNITFLDVNITANDWAPTVEGNSTSIASYITGQGEGSVRTYNLIKSNKKIVSASSNTVGVNFQVSPVNLKSGGSAGLLWNSTNATSCGASGSWSGFKDGSGIEAISLTGNATRSFTLSCRNSNDSISATIPVVVSQ